MKKLSTILISFIILSSIALADDFFGPTMLPGMGEVSFLEVDDNDNIYAGMWGGGLYISQDDGVTWSKINSLDAEFLTDMEIIGSNFYITSFDMGVYVSNNRGASWTENNNGLDLLKTKAITVLENGEMFVGTYGKGVYYSSGTGSEWQETNLGLFFRDINTLEYNMQGFVLAGTNGGGVYMTRDTGKTWIESNTGMLSDFVNDMVVDRSTGELFAATSGNGVRFSANGGISWSVYKTDGIHPYVESITLNEGKEIIGGTKRSGIYYYDDVVWFEWRRSNFLTGGFTAIAKNSDGVLFAAKADNEIIFSENDGRNWLNRGQIPEAERLELYPYGESSILASKRSGEILISRDYGETWQTNNSVSSQATSFAIDSLGNYRLGTGTGLYVSLNEGGAWTRTAFADTLVAGITVGPDGQIFLAWNYQEFNNDGERTRNDNELVVSGNQGLTWSATDADYPEAPTYIRHFNNQEIVMFIDASDSLIYNKSNGLGAWILVDGYNGLGMDVDFLAPNSFYVATQENVFKTTNQGQSWIEYNIGINNEDNTNATYILALKNTEMYVVARFLESVFIYDGIYRSYLDEDGFLAWDTISNSVNYNSYDNFEKDDSGNIYLYNGSVLYKAINRDNMVAPNLIRPLGGDPLELRPSFEWNTVELADMYELQVSSDENFTFIREHVVLADTNYTMVNELDFNDEFFWRVRAKVHDAVGPWAIGNAKTQLQTPILVSPVNDSLGVAVFADLLWEEVQDADAYRVQVAEDDEFNSIIFSDDNVLDVTVTTSQLAGLTDYFWRVQAFNQEGQSFWSEAWRFRTILGPPTLISPEDSTVGLEPNVEFVWTEVTEAINHAIQIADNQQFTDPVYDGMTETMTTHSIANLDYNTTYFWRVNSTNQDGTSDWGTPWRFRTAYEPVVLTAPENGERAANVDVLIDWEDHPDGAFYRLQISETESFDGSLLYDDMVLGESEFDPTELTLNNNQDYFWRVRLEMEDQNGLWSEEWTFRTRLSRPILRSPANNSQNQPTSLETLWTAVNNIDNYLLQVARDIDFNDLIFSQDDVTQNSYLFTELEPNTQYYWRVRASNEDGLSLWSETWTFTTGANIPELIAPENFAENVGTDIEFRWSDLPNTDSYHIVIATDNQFNNIFDENTEINALRYEVENLQTETTYFWRLRANLIEGGESPWSQIWTFNTGDGTSVIEQIIAETISIYPNPAEEALTVSFVNIGVNQSNVSIIDLSGRKVLDLGSQILSDGVNEFNINVSDLNTGVYFLYIDSQEFNFSKKFSVK